MSKSGELVYGLVWWSGLDQWNEISLDGVNSGWPYNKAIWTAWGIVNNGTTTATFSSKFSIGGQTINGTSKQLAPGAGFASQAPKVDQSGFSLTQGSYNAILTLLIDGVAYQEYPVSVIVGDFVRPTFLVEGEGEIYPEYGPYYPGQSLLITAEADFGWHFEHYKRNGEIWLVESTHTFSNLGSGEVFTAVFEPDIQGDFSSRIVNFKVSPLKSFYTPGGSVTFSGKLQWNDFPNGWKDADANVEIQLFCSDAKVDSTLTKSGGVFSLVVYMPFLEADYIYKARYDGSFIWKPCYSSQITMTVANVYLCPYCGEEFQSESELNQHVADEHGGFKCPYCEAVFSSQALLTQHIQDMHPDNEIPWGKIAIGAAALAIIIVATNKGRKAQAR